MMTTRETRLRYYVRLRIRATILKIRHYPQYRASLYTSCASYWACAR